MNNDTVPRIGFVEKAGFTLFSTSTNIVYQFRSLYYLFFLTNIMGIKVAHAGIILTIGTIWDAINDPMVGYFTVNHTFKNGEKCRPFALWCAVPWGITVVLMFTEFDVSYTMKIVIAILIYIVFELLYTFAGIPYNSMGSLATNVDSDRRSINVARSLGGCLGSGIGAVACLPIVRLFGGLDSNGNVIDTPCEEGTPFAHLFRTQSARGFFFAAVVMSIVCILGCFAHYFTTKERIKQKSEDESHLSFGQIVKSLCACKSWVVNTLYILCYGVLNVLIMSNVTYYATYVLGSTAAATPIMAVYLVVSIVMSLATSAIDKKLGRKKTIIIGAIVDILGKIWFIIDPKNVMTIYVNAVSVGISLTIAFVIFNTNRNNIADLVEWQSGRRMDSMVSTVDNLATKLGKAAATMLISAALAANGFVEKAAVQPESAVNSIIAMLGWIPMLVSAVMLVVAAFMPIEKEMAQMHAAEAAANAE